MLLLECEVAIFFLSPLAFSSHGPMDMACVSCSHAFVGEDRRGVFCQMNDFFFFLLVA